MTSPRVDKPKPPEINLPPNNFCETEATTSLAAVTIASHAIRSCNARANRGAVKKIENSHPATKEEQLVAETARQWGTDDLVLVRTVITKLKSAPFAEEIPKSPAEVFLLRVMEEKFLDKEARVVHNNPNALAVIRDEYGTENSGYGKVKAAGSSEYAKTYEKLPYGGINAIVSTNKLSENPYLDNQKVSIVCSLEDAINLGAKLHKDIKSASTRKAVFVEMPPGVGLPYQYQDEFLKKSSSGFIAQSLKFPVKQDFRARLTSQHVQSIALPKKPFYSPPEDDMFSVRGIGAQPPPTATTISSLSSSTSIVWP
ncbi:MAG: hypothetical protein ACK5NY_06295 [Burkholderiaceae bacterium]|jgi:hypothetical protein